MTRWLRQGDDLKAHYDSNWSRRQFLRLTCLSAVAGLTTLLPGCPKTQRKIRLWGTATLDISDWSDFSRTIGEAVSVDFVDNGNEPGPIIARMKPTQDARVAYHMGGVQGGVERELAAAGAIIPWNLDLIPNARRLWPWALEIKHTIVDEKRYGLPTVINADSMIYLPERTGVVDSYARLFDPDLRGHVSMEDSWVNSVIFAAIYLKESGQQRIVNPGDLTESELAEVMRFLTDHARAGQFRKLWRGWDDAVALMHDKHVWLMSGWEPIVYALRDKGINAEYAVPKEGYEGWSNDLILHAGAAEPATYELCHKFADWELAGFYGCKLASIRGYVVPTDTSVEYADLHPQSFDADKIRETVTRVKAKFFQMKGNVYWQNTRPANFPLYEEHWQRFRGTLA
jgi:putative spermidine/putrescine transport system substrate-binding protein